MTIYNLRSAADNRGSARTLCSLNTWALSVKIKLNGIFPLVNRRQAYTNCIELSAHICWVLQHPHFAEIATQIPAMDPVSYPQIRFLDIELTHILTVGCMRYSGLRLGFKSKLCNEEFMGLYSL